MIAMVSSLVCGCTQQHEKVDLLLFNATIYTVDNDFSVADAMVLKDGIIVEVGLFDDLVRRYRPAEKRDMAGAYIYPGFYDPHCHFYGYGAGLASWADLTGTRSFDEVLDVMVRFAEESDTGWLAGRGWDENNWDIRELPDKGALDSLFSDRPVILIRVDGHAMLANSVALDRGGITVGSEVPGGEVLVKDGRMTGILIDKASDQLRSMFNRAVLGGEQGEALVARGILQAQENCFGVGITTVGDAGLNYHQVQTLKQLQEKGLLKMQVYAMLNDNPENRKHYISQGPYRSERMHIRSVKFFADGALGSRGALLLEPYTDRSESVGLLTLDPERFRQQCKELYGFGYQVNTHAIGDSANRFVLGVYADILEGPNDLRWRIEHAQVVHPDDFETFGKYNIIPAINAIHATSDMGWAIDRLGPHRVVYAYAFQQLLETNGWLCNGSDFPVEPINPLLGFYAAVARKDLNGYPPKGWQPENALSRKDALKAMTIWAAKASFEEDQKGSLEPGKQADFVVLKNDIITIDESQIPEALVLQTWISGEKVWHHSAH